MRRFFLDTGYVIALEAADDQYHSLAWRHWQELIEQSPAFVTTTYVFDEVVTFFNSRGLHAKAVDVGYRLLESPRVRLIQVDQPLFQEGWKYLQRRPDKRFSLTDCISFVVMQQEELNEALSFDGHFEQAGFLRLPPIAE
jgi:predicted nucleic acid-binding protein